MSALQVGVVGLSWLAASRQVFPLGNVPPLLDVNDI
jgi:hypothetical protein